LDKLPNTRVRNGGVKKTLQGPEPFRGGKTHMVWRYEIEELGDTLCGPMFGKKGHLGTENRPWQARKLKRACITMVNVSVYTTLFCTYQITCIMTQHFSSDIENLV
jgi:hypothetical protein